MKRRTRAQIDPDCVVALSASDERAIRFRRSAAGVVMEGDWDASQAANNFKSPAATIAVLQPARMVCRTCELPDTDEDKLQAALQLQAETQQLGSVPAWRTASLVLAFRSDDGGRTGVVVDWPSSDPGPSLARDLPPDGEPLFAGDSAILAATMDGYADGPLVTVTPDRTAFSFALRTPQGLTVRSTRIDPEQWPEAATVAVVESALRGGMNAAQAETLVAQLDEAIAAAGEGGFGCTLGDRTALEERVNGLNDAAAWREHGLKALAALIWFSPKKPLVSLRAQPMGERPKRLGEWLNRLAEPQSLVRAVLLCLLVLVLAPPLFAGGRLLLLHWKVGDLDVKERSLRAYQKQLDLYSDLERRAWPMGKLLGDIANVTPEGVEWDDLTISQDRNVSIHGQAKSHDGQSGMEVVLLFERQMRDCKIFDKMTKRLEPPDGKGMAKFTLAATVTKPTLRPNYKETQDFARKTLSERRYGPAPAGAKPAHDAEDASAKSEEKPAASTELAAPTHGAASADAPSTDPMKEEPAALPSGTAATESGGAEAAPEGEAKSATAPDSGTRRGSRGARSSTARPTDLPKRSERTPDSANVAAPIPPALSDTEINAMSKEEAQAAISRVAIARQSAEVDDETKKRLKEEFDKLTKHLRGKK
ncbi:MAG: hypothetical protein K8R92_05755 [Planctomycetes bacterium]|nr:hypothetical protein [Planctomycetota bacterium]